jgi:hypothetical protein
MSLRGSTVCHAAYRHIRSRGAKPDGEARRKGAIAIYVTFVGHPYHRSQRNLALFSGAPIRNKPSAMRGGQRTEPIIRVDVTFEGGQPAISMQQSPNFPPANVGFDPGFALLRSLDALSMQFPMGWVWQRTMERGGSMTKAGFKDPSISLCLLFAAAALVFPISGSTQECLGNPEVGCTSAGAKCSAAKVPQGHCTTPPGFPRGEKQCLC